MRMMLRDALGEIRAARRRARSYAAVMPLGARPNSPPLVALRRDISLLPANMLRRGRCGHTAEYLATGECIA